MVPVTYSPVCAWRLAEMLRSGWRDGGDAAGRSLSPSRTVGDEGCQSSMSTADGEVCRSQSAAMYRD
eukprot:2803326-Prymnesium_polylepis.1